MTGGDGDSSAATLQETRRKVVEAWGVVSSQLLKAGHPLADEVWRFLGKMPKPRPEKAVLRNISETQLDKERRPKRDDRTR
jgi:hypothetical protein